jgi:hypothetical protein
MQAEILKTESLTIDGVDVDVETVKVGNQTFRIGQLSVGQVQAIIGGGAARAAGGFDPTTETIAQSIEEALEPKDRENRDATTARIAKLRLPAYNALHAAVVKLAGLKSATGEAGAAAGSTSNTSAAA